MNKVLTYAVEFFCVHVLFYFERDFVSSGFCIIFMDDLNIYPCYWPYFSLNSQLTMYILCSLYTCRICLFVSQLSIDCDSALRSLSSSTMATCLDQVLIKTY